jgi:hypothetical protein
MVPHKTLFSAMPSDRPAVSLLKIGFYTNTNE